jgi:hypothetical protein
MCNVTYPCSEEYCPEYEEGEGGRTNNTDPAIQSFHADPDNSKYLCWSVDNVRFIQIDQRILVPDSGDLWLHVFKVFMIVQSPDIWCQQDSICHPTGVYLA